MKIPTISAKNLWHWGTLEADKKFSRSISWEGNLFSMSACPDAWQAIGRFGGSDLHVRSEPTTMLDMHSVLFGETSNAKALRNLIQDWAIDQKLMTYEVIYLLTWFDDERDDFMHFECKTQAEAEAEQDGDEDRKITSTTKLISTSKLNLRHGFRESDIIGLEFAVIDWAKEHVSHRVMGVYWDEKLDPMGLSAPRAGMFNLSDLNLSSTTVVPDDQEGLAGVSGVKWVNISSLDHERSLPKS